MSAGLAPWLEPALSRGLCMPAHALLLHGPGTLGQFELGLALAGSMLCEAPGDNGRACGRCTACHLFGLRSHPDFCLLVPDALREALGWAAADDDEAASKSKAKPSRNIKVDAVRTAIDWAHQSSSRGRAKVVLIHPAEAMNEIAANALLKTLEEPPGSLRLLLSTQDPEALLPTVRSRCQRLGIGVPALHEARAWLEAQGVPHANPLLTAAGGLPHAALSLHEDGIDGAAWSSVPAWARAGQGAALSGWPVPRVVEALHKLCHDLMALAVGAQPRYFDLDALAPARRPGLPAFGALTEWDRSLRQATRHDEHPWHAPLRIEALLAQAAALWQTARPPTPARTGALDTLPGP